MRRKWTKTDLVNRLADLQGYRRYLEICTTVTGNLYREIDRSKFPVCHRLMFRCPDDFADGMPIDFKIAGLDIGECVREMKARPLRYDVILVDPWHEYDTSYRALEAALDLIDERGTIVVHDCLPPTSRHATPTFVTGDWCGTTYKAFLDFVMGRRDIAYLTVNTDFGCGVIRKLGAPAAERGAANGLHRAARQISALIGRREHGDGGRESSALFRNWAALADDYDATFDFFSEHSKALLKLVSVPRFWRMQRRWRRDARA